MYIKGLELPGLELVDSNADYSGSQTIFIDFDGAEGVSYDNYALDVHIDNITVSSSNLSEEEQFQIITDLNTTFAGTGVFFTTETTNSKEYSTIYVGDDGSAFSEYGNFLGLSETIDTGNQIKNDEAFVFSKNINSTVAITETIAHEAGHLLGFKHLGDNFDNINKYATSGGEPRLNGFQFKITGDNDKVREFGSTWYVESDTEFWAWVDFENNSSDYNDKAGTVSMTFKSFSGSISSWEWYAVDNEGDYRNKYHKSPGEQIWHKNGDQMIAKDHLIEGYDGHWDGDDWAYGDFKEDNILKTKFESDSGSDTFYIQARANLYNHVAYNEDQMNNGDWTPVSFSPTSSSQYDQQGWKVYQFTVKTDPNPTADKHSDTSTSTVGLKTGESYTFKIDAKDSGGDLASCKWYVNDVEKKSDSFSLTDNKTYSWTSKFSSKGAYKIKGTFYDDDGDSTSETWTVNVTTPNQAPSTPTNVSKVSVTHNSATISWSPSTDPEGDDVTYFIQYGRDNYADGWNPSTPLSTPDETITLNGLEAGKTYDVRVWAEDGKGGVSSNPTVNELFTTASIVDPSITNVTVNQIDDDGDGFASVIKLNLTVAGGTNGLSNGEIHVYEDDVSFLGWGDDYLKSIDVSVGAEQSKSYEMTLNVAEYQKLQADGWFSSFGQPELRLELKDSSGKSLDSVKKNEVSTLGDLAVESEEGDIFDEIASQYSLVAAKSFDEYYSVFGGKPVFGVSFGLDIDLAQIFADTTTASVVTQIARFIDVEVGAQANMFIDLADLFYATPDSKLNDGKDDWITVWVGGDVHARLAVSVPELPGDYVDSGLSFTLGTMANENSYWEDDKWDLSLGAPAASFFAAASAGWFKVKGEYSSDGFDFSMNANIADFDGLNSNAKDTVNKIRSDKKLDKIDDFDKSKYESVKFDASAGIDFSVPINLGSFEINRDSLIQAMGNFGFDLASGFIPGFSTVASEVESSAYSIKDVFVDIINGDSDFVREVTVDKYKDDNIIPTTPQFGLTSGYVKNGDVINVSTPQFDWSDSTDVDGISKYELVLYNSSTGKGYSYDSINNVSNLIIGGGVPDGYYTAKVQAYDNSAEKLGSGFSDSINFVVDTVDPSIQVLYNNSNQTLSWNIFDNRTGVAGFGMSSTGNGLENIFNGAQKSGSASVAGIAPGSYKVTAWAIDEAGNRTDRTIDFEVGDDEKPTNPGNPVASVNESAVNLNWGASIDNVQVSGYKISIWNNAGYNETFTSDDTSLDVGGLSEGAYSWEVWALDTSNNPSSKVAGNSFIIDIADSESPTTPSIISDVVSGSSVSLVWTDSTDDSGIKEYVVEYSSNANFSDAFSYTSNLSSFELGDLPLGTYYWRVKAVDTANNPSGWSTSQSFNIDFIPQDMNIKVVKISSNGDLLAIDANNNCIHVYEIDQQVKQVITNVNGSDIAFNKSGDKAYIVGGNMLTLLINDDEGWSVAGGNQFGKNLRGIDYDAVNDKLYLCDWQDGESYIFAVDAADLSVEKTITSANDNHLDIIVSPDGRYVYTGGYFGGTITRFDSQNNFASKSIDVGRFAGNLVMSTDGTSIYMLLGTDGSTSGNDTGSKVAIIDAGNFATSAVQYIELPEVEYGESHSLTIDSQGDYLFVTSSTNSDQNNDYIRLLTIDLSDNSIVDNKIIESGVSLSDGEQCLELYPDNEYILIGTKTGNIHVIENDFSTIVLDTEAPTVPENLTDSVTYDTVVLDWDNSTDVSGIKEYVLEYADNSNFTNATSQAVTASEFDLSSLPDGTWHWRVKAIDLADNPSLWSDSETFTIATPDTQAPDIPTGLTDTVTGDSISLDWSDSTDAGGSGLKEYIIECADNTSFNDCVTIVESSSSYILKDISVGTYYWRVKAQDNSSNSSAWSAPDSFKVLPADLAGNSFADAAMIDVTTPYSSEGYVGLGDGYDFYKFEVDKAGEFDFSLTDLDARVTFNLYSEYDYKGTTRYKKIKGTGSQTNRSTGLTAASLNDILLDVDTYFLEVISGDRGQGRENTDYTLDVTGSYFPDATIDECDFRTGIGTPTSLTLNSEADAMVTGWVGFGDGQDVYEFTVDTAGEFDFALTNLDARASVNLYSEYDNRGTTRYKKVKGGSSRKDRNTGLTSASFGDVLLDTGTYYLEVLSGDKGRGRENTEYTLDIDGFYFPDASDDEFDFRNGSGSPDSISLDANADATVTGWVGFGDGQDVYEFTVGTAGEFDFALTNLDARASVNLYSEYDNRGTTRYKKVKGGSSRKDRNTGLTSASFGDVLLDTGTYYLEVLSGDKGRGRENTEYTLDIDGFYFPDSSDDEFDFRNGSGSADSISLNANADATVTGWVGFGDGQDVYEFTVDTAGEFDFALTNLDARASVNLYSEYDNRGTTRYKKVKGGSSRKDRNTGLTSASFGDVLLDTGTYYLEVLSGDKGRGRENTEYTLDIDGFYFPDSSDDEFDFRNGSGSADSISLNANADATVTGWVGFGDGQDVYEFTVDTAGEFDFALTNLDARASVNLYSEYDNRGTTRYKKVKGGSSRKDRNTGLTSASFGDVLLDTGTYYLEVLSGDKGRGRENTEYTLDIDGFYFPDASDDEFDFRNGSGSADSISLNANADAMVTGWVGFGDGQDVYEFTVDTAGEFDFALTNLDARASVNLYSEYDNRGTTRYKKVKGGSSRKDRNTGLTSASFGDILLDTGTYYLEVLSGDKGRGRENTEYTLDIDGYFFPKATNDELDPKTGIGTPANLNLNSSGNGSTSGWVGFGDAYDVHKFTAECNGFFDISLSNLSATAKMSLWYYDSSRNQYKTLKSANGSEKTGIASLQNINIKGGVDYYVAVESGDKGRGRYNTFYDLDVNGNYVDLGGEYDNNPTNLGSFGEFAGMKRESMVGGEWVGGVDPNDYFKFNIADYYYYNRQRYDFDGPSWIKLEFELASDAEIEFSILDGNENTIDSVDVSNISAKGVDGYLQLEDLYPGDYYLKVDQISGGTEYNILGHGNAYEDELPPWPSSSVPVEYYLDEASGGIYNIIVSGSQDETLSGSVGQRDMYYHKAGESGYDKIYDNTNDGFSLDYHNDILVLDNVQSWNQVLIDKDPGFPDKYYVSFTHTSDSMVRLYGDEYTQLRLALYDSNTGDYSSAINAFQLYNNHVHDNSEVTIASII